MRKSLLGFSAMNSRHTRVNAIVLRSGQLVLTVSLSSRKDTQVRTSNILEIITLLIAGHISAVIFEQLGTSSPSLQANSPGCIVCTNFFFISRVLRIPTSKHTNFLKTTSHGFKFCLDAPDHHIRPCFWRSSSHIYGSSGQFCHRRGACHESKCCCHDLKKSLNDVHFAHYEMTYICCPHDFFQEALANVKSRFGSNWESHTRGCAVLGVVCAPPQVRVLLASDVRRDPLPGGHHVSLLSQCPREPMHGRISLRQYA